MNVLAIQYYSSTEYYRLLFSLNGKIYLALRDEKPFMNLKQQSSV